MSTNPSQHPDARAVTEDLHAAREQTLTLVGPLTDAELERQVDPLMSPLAWDLAHIAAYEDLWLVHRHAGLPLLREDLADRYDAFETPRAVRGEIELLSATAARDYLDAVRRRTLQAIETHGVDPDVHEMVVQHEQQHTETMLQAMELAPPAGYERSRPVQPVREQRAAGALTGLEFTAVPGGEIAIGASPGRFAYDNERPRRHVEVRPFRIARAPVTNATWLTFTEGGGYERREWWSDEAWSWKEQEDITHPGAWRRRPDGSWTERTLLGVQDLDPARPVAHVSWFEAAAFATAHGARLPTEVEWETAATWSQTAGTDSWSAARRHANLGQLRFGTTPVGSFANGAADCGALDLLGNVWEWTTTEFAGYPGFVAHPYPEYSEVFFERGYRVLRGGSWATQARVATPTFRNWDLPQRRQIFSGVRLAIDEERA